MHARINTFSPGRKRWSWQQGAQSFHGQQLELPVFLSCMCCNAERSSHLWDVSHLHWDLNQEVGLVLDADILQAWQVQQLAHGYQSLPQV